MADNTPIPSLTDPAVQLCPYAAYARLRDEAPVYKEPDTGNWVITRYEDVRAVASDWEKFSSVTNQFSPSREGVPGQKEVARMFQEAGYQPEQNALIHADPPVHRLHRAAISTAFSIPRIRAIEPYITQVVDELIDRFDDKGQIEFMSEFAVPLPMRVISDQLGVPTTMNEQFKRWSDSLLIAANIGNTAEVQIEAARNILEMREFLLAQIDALIAEPSARPKQGLGHRQAEIDALIVQSRAGILRDIATSKGEDGELLPLGQRLAIAMGVLVAGNETTTTTLGSAMRRMIEENLEQRLRADPDLIPNFIEECLRLDAPLQALVRKATQDVEMHGQTIKKNDIVFLRWAAGNRDERHYACPEKLDLQRDSPRTHLSFGHSIHMCPGRDLARAEMRIAFERLLTRLKNFRLGTEPDAITYRPAYHAYGPNKIMLHFEQA